eukprot:CAMPEP_0197032532 /NCGR_PEP_ID=MMETSP1384-20130603/11197_1 /TAXON_ID=29189 /ORGANISM="Ammonia sp." /LENGTH=186 /DNA_ID=CAMNT_0042462215 /DNA_START=159 /DNA_END=715 /DNA_ORIENTATION=+
MLASNMLTYRFKDVWQNENLFQLFATHCCREYSIETLLFIVEFEQLKRIVIDSHEELITDSDAKTHFMDSMNAMNSDNDGAFGNISDTILKVNKVANIMTMRDCIHLIKYLYDQYVDPEGLIPINISSATRDKVVNMYGKHNLLSDVAPYSTGTPSSIAENDEAIATQTPSSRSDEENNGNVAVLL